MYSLFRLILFSSTIKFNENKDCISLLAIKDWIKEISKNKVVPIVILKIIIEIIKIFIDNENISLDAKEVT